VTLTRKRRKRRPNGTGCQLCRRLAYTVVNGKRVCAKHGADMLFSLEVRRRGPCVRCGAIYEDGNGNPLQAAHVVSRRYLAVRWDPRNCHPHCLRCHKWETEHPLEGRVFWRSFLGGELFDGLEFSAKHEPPMDPKDVIERLVA
jgi:hypothetical protein